MPLFSYFVVMGPTLALTLICVSDRIEPHGSPVPTSQIVGIAKPFKPEPERSPYTITGTNFAAAHRPVAARAAAEPKPAQTQRADSLQQQQPADNGAVRSVPRWKTSAQNPIDALMSIY